MQCVIVNNEGKKENNGKQEERGSRNSGTNSQTVNLNPKSVIVLDAKLLNFQLRDKDCQTVFFFEKPVNYMLLAAHFNYIDSKTKMKRMEKAVPYKTNQKEAGASRLTPDGDDKEKAVRQWGTGDEDRRSPLQENAIMLRLYEPNNATSEHRRQQLTYTKGKMGKIIIIRGNFHLLQPVTDRKASSSVGI